MNRRQRRIQSAKVRQAKRRVTRLDARTDRALAMLGYTQEKIGQLTTEGLALAKKIAVKTWGGRK